LKVAAVKLDPDNVPAVDAVPLTMVGVPNNANALVPEPLSVISTELVDPIVSDVIFKLLPSTLTVAPVIFELSSVAQLVRVSQSDVILTTDSMSSTVTSKI
tara:strand:- start:192 stop:494 length:303 start_codon:yes stop_codon:yes gene_type:complete